MIYSYIPDPIRREPMGKTVTVSYEIQVPDGYELDSNRPVHVVDHEALFLRDGAAVKGYGALGEDLFRLRPIPAEKTWERPEWLIADYITHDDNDGWYAWREAKPVCDAGVWDVPISPGKSSRRFYLSRWFIDEGSLPTIVGPPAERIWRIVEGGQG